MDLLNQHFLRWTLPEELRWTGARAVCSGTEHCDQIANLGMRERSLVGQAVERGTKAADDAGQIISGIINPTGDRHWIVAAYHGAKIARCGELVVQTAIDDQKRIAVADLAVDDPSQIDPGLAHQIAAQLDTELRFA